MLREDFIRALFVEGGLLIGRVFMQEPALPEQTGLHVLDYERASEVIELLKMSGISILLLPPKMSHMDRSLRCALADISL